MIHLMVMANKILKQQLVFFTNEAEGRDHADYLQTRNGSGVIDHGVSERI
jgi:hypothetical protein